MLGIKRGTNFCLSLKQWVLFFIDAPLIIHLFYSLFIKFFILNIWTDWQKNLGKGGGLFGRWGGGGGAFYPLIWPTLH